MIEYACQVPSGRLAKWARRSASEYSIVSCIAASTTSAPSRSRSAWRRLSLRRTAPICASMSPYVTSGTRMLRRMSLTSSPSMTPRSTSFIGGMISPSPCELRALGSKVPGTCPPMSVQCELLTVNAAIRPSKKTGMIMRTSWLWVPPMYASFMTTMSPGEKYSSGSTPSHSSAPLTV